MPSAAKAGLAAVRATAALRIEVFMVQIIRNRCKIAPPASKVSGRVFCREGDGYAHARLSPGSVRRFRPLCQANDGGPRSGGRKRANGRCTGDATRIAPVIRTKASACASRRPSAPAIDAIDRAEKAQGGFFWLWSPERSCSSPDRGTTILMVLRSSSKPEHIFTLSVTAEGATI